MFDRVSADARAALRGFRSNRGTSALAFVILTLAIAAGTLTYSVVDAVAIRPLPFALPDRLVSIASPGLSPGTSRLASPREYFDWRVGSLAIESIGFARLTPDLLLTSTGIVESFTTRQVSVNLFEILGVRPVAGRLFRPDDERPGGTAVVILSHALWARRFGTSDNAIGQRLAFGQETMEVIGVLPKDVGYPLTPGPPPDLYVPYVPTAADRTNSIAVSLDVVGRLKSGFSIQQASADLQRIGPVVVRSLHERVVGSARAWLLIVLAAVGVVLLVACINVANLLLARTLTRAPELATREALGASRLRIAGVLVLEGLTLGLAATVAGLIAAALGVEIVKSILPPGLARVSGIAINSRVLFVSACAAVLSSLIFATAPAWLAGRSSLVGLIKAGGGPVIGEPRRHRTLSIFLVVDIAFVCVLLVVSTLVVTSFVLVTTADLGFDRRNLMTVSYQRSLDDVPEPARPAAAATLRNELLDRVKRVPGVIDAAISANGSAPLSGSSVRYSLTIPGMGETTRDDYLETRMVTPGYFDVMGMHLIRGRLFEQGDAIGAQSVMLINEVAAQRFFPNKDPIGQVVTFRGPTTIIGVLRSVHFGGPETEVRPEMYTPADQEDPIFQRRRAAATGTLIVRTADGPRGLAASVIDEIRPALGGMTPPQPKFMDDDHGRLTAGRRFNAGVMAAFGVIAIAIGAIGVYGTMAFFVAERIPAIGLRMALGASASSIRMMVLWSAVQRVVLGVGIGMIGAWAFSSALVSFVFGIRPTEPVVYIAVGGFLAAVAAGAAVVPALRAARLDPLKALSMRG